MKFKIEKNYDVKELKLNLLKVRETIQKAVESHFKVANMEVEGGRLEFDGNLLEFKEYANTKVTLNIKEQDGKLLINADGQSCFGSASWAWLVLGIFFYPVLLVFAFRVVQFLIAFRCPNAYLNEVVDELGTELRTSPEKFSMTPGNETAVSQEFQARKVIKTNVKYEKYEDVPVYRKQWFFWLLYLVFTPAAMFLLLFGDVYYQGPEKVKSFGPANRVIAGICGIGYFIIVIRLLFVGMS